MKQGIEEIKAMILQIVDLQKESICRIKKEIQFMIQNREKDSRKIEFLLDQLLDLIQTDEVSFLFQQLCTYYETISLEGSKDYQKIYQQLYEE